MKLLLLILTISISIPVHAQQFLYALQGRVNYITGSTSLVAPGDTFSAYFIVDPSAADTRPGDPSIGYFPQASAPAIQFSNGLTLSPPSFDYVLVDSYHFGAPLNATYDGIAFYAWGVTLGMEMRLPETSFANDNLQFPPSPIVPPNGDWGYFSDWYYSGISGAQIGGSLNSVTITQIPEPGTTALFLSATTLVSALLMARRKPAKVITG